MEGHGGQDDTIHSLPPRSTTVADRGLSRRALLLRSAGLAASAYGLGHVATHAASADPSSPPSYRLLEPGTRTVASHTNPVYNAFPGSA